MVSTDSPNLPVWLHRIVTSNKVSPEVQNAENNGTNEARKRNVGSKKIRNYYQQQESLIQGFKQDQEEIDKFVTKERKLSESLSIPEAPGPSPDEEPAEGDSRKLDLLMARISFAANVVLLLIKAIAAGLSGSLAVISSVVDSALDLTAGGVIWVAGRAIQKKDPYKYPRGRTRLEPLSVIVISIIMGVASLQIILTAIRSLATDDVEPDVGGVTIGIMVATIVIKFILMIGCYRFKSINTQVLAQDHRNDCISNTVAIICAYVGSHYWRYADPLGAILVSVYIAVTWAFTGWGQIKILSGKSANPQELNRITKVALEHDPRILAIDTVHAYHYGTKYLVEVDVVMDANLILKETHDIAEALQRKLERLPFIERAFVHVDYEFEHSVHYEHKAV